MRHSYVGAEKIRLNNYMATSSCIDLVLISQQANVVLNSGVHSSLYLDSHHQIAFAEFDWKVYYPSPYKRRVWHYKYANTAQIKNALASFNWEQALSNNSMRKLKI